MSVPVDKLERSKKIQPLQTFNVYLKTLNKKLQLKKIEIPLGSQ